HGLDGDRAFTAPGRGRGGREETGGRAALQHRPDAVCARAGAHPRSLAPAILPARPRGARAGHGETAARHAWRLVRGADRRVLRDAAGVADARTYRRGLREGATPCDRGPLRLWLRLRSAR